MRQWIQTHPGIFGAFLILLSFVPIFFAANFLYRGWLSYNFLPTEGIVLSVSSEYHDEQYLLYIEYQYKVDDIAYQGNSVNIEGDFRTSFESILQKKIQFFRVNEPCTVYINPNNVSESVLIPGFTQNGTIPLAITGFLFCVGLLGIYKSIIDKYRVYRHHKRIQEKHEKHHP
jgi:hypothetical protein